MIKNTRLSAKWLAAAVIIFQSSVAFSATPVAVTASGNDGNTPDNTLDNDLSTRWSAEGDGQWIQYDLGSVSTVESLDIGFYKGDQRNSTFAIQTSSDGASWNTVLSNAVSSGSDTALESFSITTTNARYVRYVGYGNSDNDWNSLTEMTVSIGSGGVSSSSSSSSSSTASSHSSSNSSSSISSSVESSSTSSSEASSTSSSEASSPSSTFTLNDCTTTVTNSDDFAAAASAAVPGDTICINGNLSSDSIKIRSKSGTAENPITIRATTKGASTLHSLVVQDGQYINVYGFVFHSDASTLLKIVNTQHVAIISNDFNELGEGAQSAIITSGDEAFSTSSDDIEIAYNTFHDHNFPGNDGQSTESGSFIKTQYNDNTTPGSISHRLWIHHNYFHNMAPHISAGETTPDGDSDRESIIFGESNSQNIVTHHIIENNLFEDCDGENEIISSKTSENIIRHNTFKNSFGSVSVRFGHGTEVSSNYFFGTGAGTTYTDPNYQTGGIRIYGVDHKIYNNYIQNLTGTTWRQPIFLDNGDTDGTGGSGHQRPQHVEIVNNTIVNTAAGLAIGNSGFQSKYNKKPKNNTIANNIAISDTGPVMEDYGESSNDFTGNIAYASGSNTVAVAASKSAEEVSITDPLLEDATLNGYTIKRLSVNSPAIGAATGSYSYLSKDINGVTRYSADVGAEEYSATLPTTLVPLTPADVGPDAVSAP